jgi:hypothetical protein
VAIVRERVYVIAMDHENDRIELVPENENSSHRKANCRKCDLNRSLMGQNEKVNNLSTNRILNTNSYSWSIRSSVCKNWNSSAFTSIFMHTKRARPHRARLRGSYHTERDLQTFQHPLNIRLLKYPVFGCMFEAQKKNQIEKCGVKDIRAT